MRQRHHSSWVAAPTAAEWRRPFAYEAKPSRSTPSSTAQTATPVQQAMRREAVFASSAVSVLTQAALTTVTAKLQQQLVMPARSREMPTGKWRARLTALS